MILRQWAAEYGIPFHAILALEQKLGFSAMQSGMTPTPAILDVPLASEGRIQAQVRLEAARKGKRLFRNNVGALPDRNGRLVRYGLANDSKQVNDVLKSSDLIGWQVVTIEPQMVGCNIAQVLCREIKEPGWSYDPLDAHSRAQKAWIDLVLSDGGDAAFATSEGTL